MSCPYCTCPSCQREVSDRVLICDIQRAVAAHYGTNTLDMRSRRRNPESIRPRHVAMYLARWMTPQSMTEIGRRFGDRDHSTVIHAVTSITELRLTDAKLDADLRTLEAALTPDVAEAA